MEKTIKQSAGIDCDLEELVVVFGVMDETLMKRFCPTPNLKMKKKDLKSCFSGAAN